jgi:antitoxin YefM
MGVEGRYGLTAERGRASLQPSAGERKRIDHRPLAGAQGVDARAVVRHNCGVTSEPLRAVRDHLSEIVDRVEREHDRVVITRNGREAAVLVSAADLAELEETLSVLSDPEALADIREADAAYARGEVVRGLDAVRALRS